MNKLLNIYTRIYHIHSQRLFASLWMIGFLIFIFHYYESITDIRFYYISLILPLYFIIQMLCIKYIHKKGLSIPKNTGLSKRDRMVAIFLFVVSIMGIVGLLVEG